MLRIFLYVSLRYTTVNVSYIFHTDVIPAKAGIHRDTFGSPFAWGRQAVFGSPPSRG